MLKLNRTTLNSRKSTINNAFVHEIVVHQGNKKKENAEWLSRFGQVQGNEKCVYCGRKATTIDHLYNLTKSGMPTGYNSDYNNLVPACSTCNSKKGGFSWDVFMNDTEMKSLDGNNERFQLLLEIEKKYPPLKIDFESVLGKENWDAYISARDEINSILEKTSKDLEAFKKEIKDTVLYNSNKI